MRINENQMHTIVSQLIGNLKDIYSSFMTKIIIKIFALVNLVSELPLIFRATFVQN